MKDKAVIIVILVVQAICAVFFVSDIALTVVGYRTTPISWQTREFLEVGAAVGLLLGVVLGAIALRWAMQRSDRYKQQLRVASGAFAELLQDRFDDWALTPAEKDVALFAIKGLSTHEIAAVRNTSEGTVKAQTNAIYRKAGVSGRPQLLSLFIEDLMGDALVESPVISQQEG
ncbi:helix-turn-helix transcriptional regulator [Actibacterium lipolyticum]|uniref:Bacterial regulatory proteins, luxR family n=1 Tax=Actibacterium lipolyticum TaxID=1524263 RepID=A0A238JLY2_9RHOB|nr:helix-turn-helix transcriptional regulator [Actibacterium lipolyticum]SMX31495.1 Bacterial regulatory proteins, luxR family [Actibacterium lipolyticum]